MSHQLLLVPLIAAVADQQADHAHEPVQEHGQPNTVYTVTHHSAQQIRGTYSKDPHRQHTDDHRVLHIACRAERIRKIEGQRPDQPCDKVPEDSSVFAIL